MIGLPLSFVAPAALVALVLLAALYLFLRVTPPRPREVLFPPLRLLLGLDPKDQTPHRTPWPLLLLRIAICAAIILAMAGPIWNAVALPGGGPGPLLVLIDDGWPAAPTWDRRVAAAGERLAAAGRAGRPAALVPISRGDQEIAPLDPAGNAEKLRALAPAPFAPDHAGTLAAVQRFLAQNPRTEIQWIADGLDLGGASAFARRLAELAKEGGVTVLTDRASPLGLASVDNLAGALQARVLRADANGRPKGVLRALDAKGLTIGEAPFDFGAERVATAQFDLPIELRNDVARVIVADERSAGAVALLDERWKRRRVAIASGASADIAQPLLAPNYYLARALAPFADIREWHDSATDPVISLLAEKPAVLALADMSLAGGPAHDALAKFVDDGGVLIRFAGARLAATTDDLTPTALRHGGRTLGGALSWETPKKLAPFDRDSPFAGLVAPDEVTISRQVLAEPGPGLAEKTWARLADGTPLVTADRRGKGLIVLFHVTADTTWSNLPLSGLFVDMLRKIVALAGQTPPDKQAASGAGAAKAASLAPVRTLDGFGALGAPPVTAMPIAARFFGGRRRRPSAGLLWLARRADRGQCARSFAGIDRRFLRAVERGGGRSRRRRADRPAPVAARRRLCRASGRHARQPVARRRVRPPARREDRGGAADPSRLRRRSDQRSGDRRRTDGDFATRHGRRPVDPPRLCRHRRRGGRRDEPRRASPTCRRC